MSILPRAVLAGLIIVCAATADASSNHLVNAHFGTNLSGWALTSSSDYTITQTSSFGDAAAGAASVHGSITSRDSQVVLTQFAAVKAGFTYYTSASFRYEPGYPEKPYAVVHTVWFPAAGCTGTPLGSFDSSASVFSGMDGVWQHLQSVGAFYLINSLFAAGPAPLGPADVNNTDIVDVADVFYLINFLFAGGPAPL
jgi:hypothetical protein